MKNLINVVLLIISLVFIQSCHCKHHYYTDNIKYRVSQNGYNRRVSYDSYDCIKKANGCIDIIYPSSTCVMCGEVVRVDTVTMCGTYLIEKFN